MPSSPSPLYRNHPMPRVLAFILLAAVLCAGACSSTTIAIKEKLGIPKRDQLVARVKDARDDQQAAKKQFASALDEFISVTGAGANASVADLEAKYDKLKTQYERSESR